MVEKKEDKPNKPQTTGEPSEQQEVLQTVKHAYSTILDPNVSGKKKEDAIETIEAYHEGREITPTQVLLAHLNYIVADESKSLKEKRKEIDYITKEYKKDPLAFYDKYKIRIVDEQKIKPEGREYTVTKKAISRSEKSLEKYVEEQQKEKMAKKVQKSLLEQMVQSHYAPVIFLFLLIATLSLLEPQLTGFAVYENPTINLFPLVLIFSIILLSYFIFRRAFK